MEPNKVFLLAFFSIYLFTFSFIQANNNDNNCISFSVDLIHRDSAESPFYNPLGTHYDRMNKAIQRSISGINRFKPSSSSSKYLNHVQSMVTPDRGEYLINISLGTPPVEFLGIIDSGSDIVWTQCEPCEYCFNQTIPIFNPNESSTYKDLSCSSIPCESLDGASCVDGKCIYVSSYADGSGTTGNLATETLTMQSSSSRKGSVKLPKIVFGCGHWNNGTFNGHGSGLVGFGGGPGSFVTQLGSRIDGKFSYCLVPWNLNTSSSKMHFGQEAIVSGAGSVSTPMVDMPIKSFYYLTLESISVGDKKLAYKDLLSKPSADFEDHGNIIIDSGTTLTILPSVIYVKLERAVRNAIDLEPVEVPELGGMLCYQVAELVHLKAPLMTFQFTGADVVLKPLNTFIQVNDNLFCLALVPDNTISAAQFGIFGNIAQMNFLVGYDLKAKTVSFKPTDCTKH
ncbi:Aspartic proteinase cdr1 [Thalictrum thalictroides]|uniref:Aspartic proteinase cdr1 n=1 Tax=Thalictrum thalictroides TaxID=46969 RepID=A0A7J6VN07_THATH|nr:Aspartic proteinase cdr1 [Thalictrum thalictroides]